MFDSILSLPHNDKIFAVEENKANKNVIQMDVSIDDEKWAFILIKILISLLVLIVHQ